MCLGAGVVLRFRLCLSSGRAAVGLQLAVAGRATGGVWGSAAVEAARHVSVRDIVEEEQRQRAAAQQYATLFGETPNVSASVGLLQRCGLHMLLQLPFSTVVC